MPSQIEKLEAYASHLLDAFLSFRVRYSLLEPMLFDAQVIKERGSGKQAYGFLVLRDSLFISCALDIVKLSLDDDKRTPSIRNLMCKLEDQIVCDRLRQTFAQCSSPAIQTDTEPEMVEALKRRELGVAIEKNNRFKNRLAKTKTSWCEFAASPAVAGFRTIRDKVAAHTEVQFVANRYQFADIENLGIKRSDMRKTIEKMQDLVESLSFLIRNAGFNWELLDKQLSKESQYFWLVSDENK